MRNGFVLIVSLLVCYNLHGQTFDQCIPDKLSDTLTLNQYYGNAQYYFNHKDYLKAASYFHEAEKIIPNCLEIKQNLAACYWSVYQDCSDYDIKHMLLAKKYMELCLQDRWIPRNIKYQYQNCLDEINNVSNEILVQKYYSNGRYYGETKDGKRDGFGIFYYNNGQRYEGRWIDDKKEDFEGELFNSKNELIYKGFFHDDERFNYGTINLTDDIKYWESIENSNDIAAYRRYLEKYGETGLYKDDAHNRIALLQHLDNQILDSVIDSSSIEIDEYIKGIEKSMKKDNLERNFIDFTYSLSGYYSLRMGAMHHSRWGFYNSYGVKGFSFKNGFGGMRYTLGALYAPTNWMYVYAGGGVALDSLKANYSLTSELGLLFRAGFVSLSTGMQIHNMIHNPSFDFSFGLGVNINAFRVPYAPFTYYVYSPTAPVGVMCAWYRNSISGYFKIQAPVYIDKIHHLIDPEYKDKPVRYSFTTGATTSLTSWLGFYAGLGLGIYKDKLDDNTKELGLDAEIGVSLRVTDIVSVSAGLHGVNMANNNRYLTYDIGIGISTWRAFLKRANHNIWEYSYSETANIGIMNGFIYDWYGYYNRIQLTNPFQKNQQHNNSDKWKGSRYSLTLGPMIALSDWLMIHGGIGLGFYTKGNAYKTTDLGFEAELGVSLRAWLFDVSFGPHWCRIGKDDAFLDYNLGVGVNIPFWLGNSTFGNHGAPFGRFRYSGHTRFGMDFGFVFDQGGFYIGILEALPEIRFNLSAGAIFTPSALMHFSIGPGIGIYTNGADPAIGFDLEAMFSFVAWKFPITIGIKMCRIGSPYMFIEPIYGLGAFQFD